MAPRRGSHEQKSPADRERYIKSVLNPGPGPTLDDLTDAIDATGTTIPEETELPPSYKPTKPRSPRRKRSVLAKLRENWRIAVVVVVLPVAGWALHAVYALNREVGELRVQLNDTKTDLQQFKDDSTQRMNRMDDRMNDSLDRASNRH